MQYRIYPVKSLSLCTIRREVRKTIARHRYKDIDASNAHPEIIYQTCKYNKIECLILEDYVKNRDKRIKEIMTIYKVSKDNAKLLFIILLYFGSFETWLKTVKLDLKTEPTEFILEFIKDRDRYGKEIEDNNPDIQVDIMKNKHKQNKYEYNERASVIAVWCQEIENRILETIYKYCITRKDSVYLFYLFHERVFCIFSIIPFPITSCISSKPFSRKSECATASSKALASE